MERNVEGMAGHRSWILGGLSMVSVVMGAAQPALAEVDLTAAIDAIREYRCGAEYWTDPIPSPPAVLRVAMRSEGQIARVVVEGLDGPNWIMFYTITSKGTKAVVDSLGATPRPS